jgi:hypothetical protein
MCDKSDGIEILEKRDGVFCGFDDFLWNITMNPFKNVMYPLLLQRAIEGVNASSDEPTIEISGVVCVYEVHPEDDGWFPSMENGIDDAKQSALLYIYELEQLDKPSA